MGRVKTVWEDCDILVVGGGMAGTGAAFNGLARTLGGVPLGAMERYARRKGGEHERVLEKVKAQYWQIGRAHV